MPVCRTNRNPRPAFSGSGFGTNGSMSEHSSSDTIHGCD